MRTRKQKKSRQCGRQNSHKNHQRQLSNRMSNNVSKKCHEKHVREGLHLTEVALEEINQLKMKKLNEKIARSNWNIIYQIVTELVRVYQPEIQYKNTLIDTSLIHNNLIM
jgi:hypothetical protein